MTAAELHLVTACRQGSAAGQERLYRTYAARLMGVCLRYAATTAEAEDVLIQGFTKAFANLDSFADGSLEGWLKRIVVREAIDQFRKSRRAVPTEDVAGYEAHPATGEAPEALTQLSAQHLQSLIAALPEGARLVFNLYAVEGYTHPEIAQMMGISVSTSKSQYARARQLLAAQLHRHDTLPAYGRER